MIPKFRAWDTFDADMVNDIFFSWQDCGYDSLNECLSDERWKFMQSTGLFDKNGVEIFEGDVVRWGMYSPGGHELYHRYAKVQMHPDLQFKILFYVDSRNNERKKGDGHIFRYGSFAYRKTEVYLEIIGNIYENPELVEG